jgi:hypothetical protein
MNRGPYPPFALARYVLEEKGINRLRFAEAEALLGEGGNLIDETGRNELQGSSRVLVAQVTRAAHTYEAAVEACRIGRGVQASMLNRSLFEDVLDIHWVAENPDLAPERAEQHDRLMALAEHQMELKFERTDRELTTEELIEFDDLVEIYGGMPRALKASWTRSSFEERFALVQDRWENEPEARSYLDYIYEVIQRQNNLLLHSSPTAYRQTLYTTPDGQRFLNRAGPDTRWTEALSHAAGGFYMACRVLAQEFGFDKEPMAEVFSQTTNYCRSLRDFPNIEQLDPGLRCPCGSGRSVSDCHLSLPEQLA